MLWLRLDTRARFLLLTLVMVETLGMMLVQQMMLARLIVIYVLRLCTIWTAELLAALTVSVPFTPLALLFLLTLRPWSRGKAAPTALAEDWVVEPLS